MPSRYSIFSIEFKPVSRTACPPLITEYTRCIRPQQCAQQDDTEAGKFVELVQQMPAGGLLMILLWLLSRFVEPIARLEMTMCKLDGA